MLKILLKKQLLEVNRSLFVNQKNGKARSKASIIFSIALYAFVCIGILGGMFGFFGSLMVEPLVEMGYSWLFFLLYAFIGLLLGLFGSVFNTYGCLYAAKDNDLLLSLPVPLKTVIVSRLSTVYILGLGFAALAYLPGFVVYCIYFTPTFQLILGQIATLLVLSVITLILSALLGLLIAKIATKIKSKTFLSVVATLVFIVLYYVFYFKAQDFVLNIVEKAGDLADGLQGSAAILYRFGLMTTGDWTSMGIFVLASLIAFVILVKIVSLNFVKLATTVASSKKVDTRIKTQKVKSVAKALRDKEVGRVLASSQYILNCCLGVLLIPVAGILLLAKGADILSELGFAPGDMGDVVVIIIGMICMLSSMIDTAAPSVSLEGDTHWIGQSLPVKPWVFLREKMNLEWMLAAIPTAFTQICALIVLKPSIEYTLILILVPQIYLAFSSVVDVTVSVFFAKYNWSNEIYPIKQSMSVTIALFSGWIIAAGFVALYFVLEANPLVYIGIWTALFIVGFVVIYRIVRTEGAKRYIISE